MIAGTLMPSMKELSRLGLCIDRVHQLYLTRPDMYPLEKPQDHIALLVSDTSSRLIIIPLEVLRRHTPLPHAIPASEQRSLASRIRTARQRLRTLVHGAADIVVGNAHFARVAVVIRVARLCAFGFGEGVDLAGRRAVAVGFRAAAAAFAVDDALVAAGDFGACWASSPGGGCGGACGGG